MAELMPAKGKQKPEARVKEGETGKEPELKGAFASVMIVGFFILITWFGVFALFLARN
ncbi:cytochrome c oxidase subunit 2A [Paenibacillus lutrae]|uniref:Cytochrome c oxidase subunit 2A n=1 Tax=Paenibacillus lutrae TaxID=2078573 RepID=A0A7X3FIB9_9BACL|nr:cytochrome c oxidase subunit 2A [Paenibacillus lutrae]MVP00208.1 cytochrome c oxidase subunit 2A [Paenibacillus lutrae]